LKEIKLTQDRVAIVGDEDYERLNQHTWCAIRDRHTYYAHRKTRIDGKMVGIMMHREILGLSPCDGILSDHKNRNGLDNQRENLRTTTYSHNAHNCHLRKDNTSGFRGVNWHKDTGQWVAKICIGRKIIQNGYYHDKVDAALAYDQLATKYHGDKATLNFPLPQTEGGRE
jgi:hypothetical protein